MLKTSSAVSGGKCAARHGYIHWLIISFYYHHFCACFHHFSYALHCNFISHAPICSLFHEQKSKSETAAKAVRGMNPQMNITAHVNRLDAHSEEVYGYDFFMGLDGAAAALDNIPGSEGTSSYFIVNSKCHNDNVRVSTFFFSRDLSWYTLCATPKAVAGWRNWRKQGWNSGGGASPDNVISTRHT